MGTAIERAGHDERFREVAVVREGIGLMPPELMDRDGAGQSSLSRGLDVGVQIATENDGERQE